MKELPREIRECMPGLKAESLKAIRMSSGGDVELDDLIQVGLMELLRVFGNPKYDRTKPLWKYARQGVVSKIRRELNKSAGSGTRPCRERPPPGIRVSEMPEEGETMDSALIRKGVRDLRATLGLMETFFLNRLEDSATWTHEKISVESGVPKHLLPALEKSIVAKLREKFRRLKDES